MTYLDDLAQAVRKTGTGKKAAAKLGITPSYLSDVLNGRRSISFNLAVAIQQKLGLDGLELLKAQVIEEWKQINQGRENG